MNLFIDESETGTPTLVGENCHIVAESDEFVRSDPAMSLEQRNSYANLILLCRIHHKLIDDLTNGENDYPVSRLNKIKLEHEAWVSSQLGYDAQKQFDDEEYAQIVDDWHRLCHVSHWMGWSSYVLGSGQPRMSDELNEHLEEARRWLISRIWPKRYADLEFAFNNFRSVLEDFHNLFSKHAERSGSGGLFTRKFYQIDRWDEELYHRLAREYDFHVDLVSDLMLELTRAANLICDMVRKNVDRNYHRKDGLLLVQRGPNSDLSYSEFPVEYSASERAQDLPYKGIDNFMISRSTRDYNIGSGQKST
jgi:hypothetical protein